MGDMGDLFNGWREDKREKRARNRSAGAQILRDHQVAFVERNFGAHLIVGGCVDFWPGTGKWIDRRIGRSGRGVGNLLTHLGK